MKDEVGSPPGQLFVSKLRERWMLPPSLAGREGDKRYLLGIIGSFLIGGVWGTVLLVIGLLSPKYGYLLGNFFSVHGIPGQIMSGFAVLAYGIAPYFHIKLLTLKTAPFLEEILAYDEPEDRDEHTERSTNGKQPLLTGRHRSRMASFIQRGVSMIIVIEKFNYYDTMVGVAGLCIVAPLVIEGITVRNVIHWTGAFFEFSFLVYYISEFLIYPLGLWFLCKSHLDAQVDYMMETMEDFHKSKILSNTAILNLDIYYRKLVKRVKEFNSFSCGIITPYRLDMSFSYLGVMFAGHQQDNIYFTIALDIIMIVVYAASLAFLSTGGSLSSKRKKAYFLANQLFVKVSKAPHRSLAQLVILRRMIKDLGNETRPTICLMDGAEGEFDSMEFVEFIAQSFANIALVANLWQTHVK